MNTRCTDAVIERRGEEPASRPECTVKQRYIAPTVEECHAIEVKLFRNREKQWDIGGELTWIGQRSGRVSLALRYRVIGIPGAEMELKRSGNLLEGPLLIFASAGTTQTIRLRACAGGFGGTRYYFECPSCQRNYRKLFLPPSKSEFACRRCEGLRYTSQRRDLDFFLKPIAAKTGAKRRVVRRYLEELREAVWQLKTKERASPRSNGLRQ
jgi:hypothetical protein